MVICGPEPPEVSETTDSCDFISSPPGSDHSLCKILACEDGEGDEPSRESNPLETLLTLSAIVVYREVATHDTVTAVAMIETWVPEMPR